MKKVLVIDDNHDILEVLNLILQMEGYHVKCCDDGQVVGNTVQDFSPDLILLDIMLNGIDGRDVCRALKNSAKTNNIPIIMISASHSIYSVNEKGCEADDFIAKPFEISNLIKKVEKHIN